MFDTITGLPVHPLVVHAAVALYPLGTLMLLATLLMPRLRRWYGWPAIVLVALGSLFVFVAKESGEALAHRIGEPQQHAEYGDIATVVAFLLTVSAILWWLLDRLHARKAARAIEVDGAVHSERGAHAVRPTKPSMLGRLLGVLTGLLALAGLVTIVLVGHSGAEAVWKDRLPSKSSAATAAKPSATQGSYTLAQVAQHKDATSCWVAVKAPGESTTGVYDLTAWITQHPGGPEPIKGLCGTNGTEKFLGKHGEDGPKGEPEQKLAGFKVGTLAG